MQTSNTVIDLSHFNREVDFNKVRAGGILGVIHKATQGIDFEDPAYAARSADAIQSGLLWGAYHFGTGITTGADQAKFFLQTVQPGPSTLMALDLESDSGGCSMTIEQARDFAIHVHDATGRWPGVYGGEYLKSLLGSQSDAILGECWLWLAQYTPEAEVPANWSRWTLWQYTDGTAGSEPRQAHGVGICDRNRFQGSVDELVRFWNPLPCGL